MIKLLHLLASLFARLASHYEKWSVERLLGAARSPKWRAFRAAQIKERGGRCELCGGTDTLELHHLESFASNPSRELDPSNVCILCESGNNGIVCHRAFGHLGDYKKINKECLVDVRYFGEKIRNR